MRQNIGIIFQQPSLDFNLTGEENVRFHTVLYGLYPFRPTFSTMPRAYKQQVLELASLLGLEQEMGKTVKKFSGGMRRKLEIIRSLLHKPSVLFLDEPPTGLDPVSRRTLWEYLRQVRHEHGTTIFLTTHYLDEAEEADQTCIINHGRIVASGSPEQVKSQLTETYLLIDAEDRSQLRGELRRLKIEFTETSSFKINLRGTEVQKIIKAIETPLSSVKTHDPSPRRRLPGDYQRAMREIYAALTLAYRDLLKLLRNSRYTYGYGRAEDLAGAAIVVLIFISAVEVYVQSLQKIIHPMAVNNLGWVAAAAFIGFLGNELAALLRLRAGQRIRSPRW